MNGDEELLSAAQALQRTIARLDPTNAGPAHDSFSTAITAFEGAASAAAAGTMGKPSFDELEAVLVALRSTARRMSRAEPDRRSDYAALIMGVNSILNGAAALEFERAAGVFGVLADGRAIEQLSTHLAGARAELEQRIAAKRIVEISFKVLTTLAMVLLKIA